MHEASITSDYICMQSEDLRLLREEIESGLANLQKVNSLRDECTKLDWQRGADKDRPLRSFSLSLKITSNNFSIRVIRISSGQSPRLTSHELL